MIYWIGPVLIVIGAAMCAAVTRAGRNAGDGAQYLGAIMALGEGVAALGFIIGVVAGFVWGFNHISLH